MPVFGPLWRKAMRRKLRAAAMSSLPKFLAHRWIRNSLDLAVPKKNSNLRFEIAANCDDLKAALTLVQKNFQREGYTRATKNGLRLTPYHLLPETLVAVAKQGEKVVATVSLVPRTEFGVPLDSCFPLDEFLKDKGRVVEISALAVDPDVRGQQGEVLYNLMKFMYHCNVDVVRANTEVIGVNPKMTPLYEAILLFEPIPGTQRVDYDFANGAPVVPMYFSLDTATTAYSKAYDRLPPRQNLMDFFLIPPPPQFTLPSAEQLDELLPQRRATELAKILDWDRDVLINMDQRQKDALLRLYEKWPACADLIRKVQ